MTDAKRGLCVQIQVREWYSEVARHRRGHCGGTCSRRCCGRLHSRSGQNPRLGCHFVHVHDARRSGHHHFLEEFLKVIRSTSAHVTFCQIDHVLHGPCTMRKQHLFGTRQTSTGRRRVLVRRVLGFAHRFGREAPPFLPAQAFPRRSFPHAPAQNSIKSGGAAVGSVSGSSLPLPTSRGAAPKLKVRWSARTHTGDLKMCSTSTAGSRHAKGLCLRRCIPGLGNAPEALNIWRTKRVTPLGGLFFVLPAGWLGEANTVGNCSRCRCRCSGDLFYRGLDGALGSD